MEWLQRWWLEATAGGGVIAATIRWYLSRRSGSSPSGLVRQFFRFMERTRRAELKDAGDDLTAEEMQGLREDIKRILIDNDWLRSESSRTQAQFIASETENRQLKAQIRELRTALDGSGGSVMPSTAGPTTKTPRQKRRVRPSVKSAKSGET